MQLHLEKSLPTTIHPTERALHVASMFGLNIDDHQTLRLIPPTTLQLNPSELAFITGPSGSGKSTILNLIHHAADQHPDIHPIRFDQLPDLPDRPLVDCFEADLQRTLHWLSIAGLNDAHVMLRTPAQLSDGQRYRLRLAHTFALCHATPHRTPLVLADEFGAALDRQTASVIARNVRKWTRTANAIFIAATTHDDLLEPLEPDILIEKPLSSTLHITHRDDIPNTLA